MGGLRGGVDEFGRGPGAGVRLRLLGPNHTLQCCDMWCTERADKGGTAPSRRNGNGPPYRAQLRGPIGSQKGATITSHRDILAPPIPSPDKSRGFCALLDERGTGRYRLTFAERCRNLQGWCGHADTSASESRVLRFGIHFRTSVMLSSEEPTGISDITKVVMTIGKAELICTARSRAIPRSRRR